MLNLPGRIAVKMPTWLDMDPDGKPIDEVGVAPDVPVKAKPSDFRGGDPVLEAALERLRKIPKEEREPGKR
jgi:C-terminal processing protease CtpA/Prc